MDSMPDNPSPDPMIRWRLVAGRVDPVRARLKSLARQREQRESSTRLGGAMQRLMLAVMNARIAASRGDKVGPDEVARHDWNSNTGRMGVRATDRIRDTWRGSWIRLVTFDDDETTGAED